MSNIDNDELIQSITDTSKIIIASYFEVIFQYQDKRCALLNKFISKINNVKGDYYCKGYRENVLLFLNKYDIDITNNFDFYTILLQPIPLDDFYVGLFTLDRCEYFLEPKTFELFEKHYSIEEMSKYLDIKKIAIIIRNMDRNIYKNINGCETKHIEKYINNFSLEDKSLIYTYCFPLINKKIHDLFSRNDWNILLKNDLSILTEKYIGEFNKDDFRLFMISGKGDKDLAKINYQEILEIVPNLNNSLSMNREFLINFYYIVPDLFLPLFSEYLSKLEGKYIDNQIIIQFSLKRDIALLNLIQDYISPDFNICSNIYPINIDDNIYEWFKNRNYVKRFTNSVILFYMKIYEFNNPCLEFDYLIAEVPDFYQIKSKFLFYNISYLDYSKSKYIWEKLMTNIPDFKEIMNIRVNNPDQAVSKLDPFTLENVPLNLLEQGISFWFTLESLEKIKEADLDIYEQCCIIHKDLVEINSDQIHNESKKILSKIVF